MILSGTQSTWICPQADKQASGDGNPREHKGTRGKAGNSQEQHENSTLHIGNSPRTRGELRLSHGNPNPRVWKSVCQSGSSLTCRCRSGLALLTTSGPTLAGSEVSLLSSVVRIFRVFSRIFPNFAPIFPDFWAPKSGVIRVLLVLRLCRIGRGRDY